MNKIYLIGSICLLLASCNPSGNSGESASTDSSNAGNLNGTDSINDLANGSILFSDSLLKDTLLLPIQFITTNVLPIPDNKEGSFEIRAALMMDSLKKSNKLKDYLDKLDVGQTKEATAYVYDTIHFGKASVVVWGIKHGTFEACPYSSGKSIFLTSFVNQKPVTTERIMGIINSADAPYYMSTNSWCKLEPTKVIACVDSVESGGEMISEGDKEFEESVSYTVSRKFQLGEDGSIKEIENKKSTEKKQRKSVEVDE